MGKISLTMNFLQKSSEIWYTSHVRVFQNNQMGKIGLKMNLLQKSSVIWYTSHVRVFQNSQMGKLVWMWIIHMRFIPQYYYPWNYQLTFPFNSIRTSWRNNTKEGVRSLRFDHSADLLLCCAFAACCSWNFQSSRHWHTFFLRSWKSWKKFAWKCYSEPWKASLLRVFVQIVTLTVAFFDGVSRTLTFFEYI